MQRFDAVIIGGGLTGVSIAYGLAGHGLATAIIDEGDVAFRASRGTFGLVWLSGKGDGMPHYVGWTRLSTELWLDFADELRSSTGVDTDYSRCGGLYYCFGDAHLAERRGLLERINRAAEPPGCPYEVWDRKAVLERMPMVGPEVTAAIYCPVDGDCNPLALLSALHKAFRLRRGVYLPNRRVTALRAQGDATVVTANGEEFCGDRVVLAAGLGNLDLGSLVGISVPMAPSRGQILVSERVAPVLPMLSHTIRQTREGSILFGDSHENVGMNSGVTPDVMGNIARAAARTYPFLSSVRIVRAWGCLRPMPFDRYPVYDRIPALPNTFLVNSHSGVTLAAVHAGPLAGKIAEGDLGAELRCYRMDRFSVQDVV